MENRQEIKEFLTTRRAKITPEQAGLPSFSEHRRVPGLRREEVALLAGVSVDYYTRLERGNMGGVSEDVLEALCRALQLDDAERMHLFDLARAANKNPSTRRKAPSERVRPSVQRVLDSIVDAPAFLRNGRMDILGYNRLGYALYSEVFTDIARPANTARFCFLNPRARTFFVDWEGAANTSAGLLRAEAGRDPHNRALIDLVGELSTQSHEFRQLWAAHDVRLHRTGLKQLRHPVVGELDLTYESMEFPSDGLVMNVYGTEPGSPSADALKLLGSWAATLEQIEEFNDAEVSAKEES